MIEANELLYTEWQRARAAGGYKERDGNRHALQRLEDYVGGKRLDTLDKGAIRDWVASMDDLAPSSRLTYFSAARAFYAFCAEDEIIDSSPMAGMSQPKNPRRPVPIPPDDDVRKLIAVCEDDKSPMGKRDRTMVRIMCDTGGPRATEVAEMLIWGRATKPRGADKLGINLAPQTATITVVGKGDKTRTWPIAAKTARAASQWLRAREGLRAAEGNPRLWVGFRAKPGTQLTRSGVQDILDRRCDEAGIPRIHPHQLRHFSYHHFLRAGGRKGDAMTLYGWDDETMPTRYAAALQEERALEAGTVLAIGDQ